ncbi:hypothetical protein [Mannheimia bovis]|uniref:Uncharacterized protein n=1 Tax=Mannheimia bovis TaxID=2770636 RepID=A0A7H1C0P4_9PAST|nr:hypothetical protein [Mannheimia bovis]QNS14549.1 hypothetical protein ICJ55_07210 [Mannheimia bovis]
MKKKVRVLLSVPFKCIAVLIVLMALPARYVSYLLSYPIGLFVAVSCLIETGNWNYQKIVEDFKCDFNPI